MKKIFHKLLKPWKTLGWGRKTLRVVWITLVSLWLFSVLQVLLGILLLNNKFLVAEALPIIFAFWMLMEGINLAVRALDYRRVGFPVWWLQLCFGIGAALLGLASLREPLSVGGSTLSATIGIGLILIGVTYLVGLAGVSRFQRRLAADPWIDEQ
jgi:uncharacterized membrane protein HdeD (DUF308 family)